MNLPENTGRKVFTLLVEYSNLTNQPTGRQKPNDPADPDYIEPIEDLEMCPLPVDIDQEIEVVFNNPYAGEVSVVYGQATITRSTSGTWTVPQRTYEGVIFKVDSPSQVTLLRITYNGDFIKQLIVPQAGQYLIPGLFPAISRLEISSGDAGDFNNDFNDDFFN